MTSRVFYTVIFLITCSWSMAQQEYQLAGTSFNPYYLNPAGGGLTDVMQFEITGRTQWMGYAGGPKTMLVIGHSQVNFGKEEKVLSEYNVRNEPLQKLPEVTTKKIKHVIGGKMGSDGIGPFSKTSAYGSYAIHMPFVKDVNFGAGLGLGWSNLRINEDRVVLYEQDDQAYQSFLGSSSQMNFADVSAGLVLYHERFFFGLSTTQLLRNKVTFNGNQTLSNFNRHYFLVGKYKFEMNTDLDLEPIVVVKLAENSPLSADLGARLFVNGSSWIGAQYRSSNALVFQVGTTLFSNLYFSYAYEFATGKISTANNSTHELQLGIFVGNNRNIDKELKENIRKAGESEGE